MHGTRSQADEQRLEALYPAWRVWCAEESGTWWAARRGPLTLAQSNAGAQPFANAASAEALEHVLAEQDQAAKCPS